jgi:centromere protein C
VPPPKEDVYALPQTDEEDAVEQIEEPELPVPDESLQFVQDDGYDEAAVLEEPSEVEQISSPSRRRTSRMSDRHSHAEPEEVEEDIAPIIPITKKKGRPRKSLQDEDATAQSSKAAQKPVQRRGGKAPLRSTKQTQPAEESTISVDDSLIDPSLLEEPPRSKPTTSKAKGKGRSRQLPTPEETQPSADDPIETTELDDSFIAPPPPPKQRGKASSKRKLAVYEESEASPEPEAEVEEIPEVEEATEIAPPTKKARKNAATKKSNKNAPKDRDPNTLMAPPSFAKPSLPQHARGSSTAPTGARWDESMWANSRNMSRLRDPTPSAEAMVGRTRSGRQVIKPLNHFANERAQYGRDGTLLAVQTAETVERPTAAGGARPGAGRGRSVSKAPGRGVSRRRVDTIQEEDEEGEEQQDEEMEDWEARGEMIYGEVNGYDPLTGQTTDEMFETGESRFSLPLLPTRASHPTANTNNQTELGWSATSIPLMPVSSANFGFAKLLSMPFFGSGIMDFPVGGFKKPRNSGKTSLHVFVHTGKVFVRIGGTKVVGSRFKKRKGEEEDEVEGGNSFLVSRGGSFHVPRGEFGRFVCLWVLLCFVAFLLSYFVSLHFVSHFTT